MQVSNILSSNPSLTKPIQKLSRSSQISVPTATPVTIQKGTVTSAELCSAFVSPAHSALIHTSRVARYSTPQVTPRPPVVHQKVNSNSCKSLRSYVGGTCFAGGVVLACLSIQPAIVIGLLLASLCCFMGKK